MSNIKFSKAELKRIEKSREQFSNDLYFYPKRRAELRKSCVKSLEGALEELRKPLSYDATYQQAQERCYVDRFADIMSGYLDLIDNVVPQALERWELVNTRFKLYKQPKGKLTVIKTNYKKGIPKKCYQAYLVIPAGFPKIGSRTKARRTRDAYEVKDLKLVDEGTFSQTLKSFKKVIEVFKGKRKTIKFELTVRGKDTNNCWLRIIK